jgi:hypothetical protein
MKLTRQELSLIRLWLASEMADKETKLNVNLNDLYAKINEAYHEACEAERNK